MAWRIRIQLVLQGVVILVVLGWGLSVGVSAEKVEDFRGQVEADWGVQDTLRLDTGGSGGKVNRQADAAGGCDGIINGEWGFHTENEVRPWWQVDLGKRQVLERMVVYNRVVLAQRTARMIVLVSDDGENFKKVYQHDGKVFYGYSDKKPLEVKLGSVRGRYVRLQLPGKSYFHLDEVEIYGTGSKQNLALHKRADQSSISQWSAVHPLKGRFEIDTILKRGFQLGEDLKRLGVEVREEMEVLRGVGRKLESSGGELDEKERRELYLRARRAVRRMALANPLLDFEKILFVKRAPGSLPHMSDQYYGWWSRGGGGIYLLEGFREGTPRIRCVTKDWPVGSFLRPDLSHDGRKVLFAYCKYYPQIAGMEKAAKDTLPEDCFYHIFEMDIDGGGVRQLTKGRYDDFDSRYLPNGEIVFLSTRKGQFVQCSLGNTETTRQATQPDSYVRCGGDNKRPVAVFTLHKMKGNGEAIQPLSAFENFEWTPSVARDGRILYARWDYIDRFNGHYMSLWSTNQNGSNPQLVYGNFTTKPQCIFEARSVPGSHKLIFTASAHHSITGGSLVLLDSHQGTEYDRPLERLSREVCFPESEGWPLSYYANPYPLSEDYYLVAWSTKRLPPHRGSGEVKNEQNPVDALGLYLYDRFGNLELLYRDPELSSMYPLPVRERERPMMQPGDIDWEGPQEGGFLVQNVYEGLEGVEKDSIKYLRIIGVPPKTQPHMHNPSIGITREDPGKFVMGTVPVEADGSAHFRVPSGISVFFQAVDAEGYAVQTMRSLTYVQPGQTLSCIGCHERRDKAPRLEPTLAARRPAGKITLGPEGSWPLRFDTLVQPVLDRHCVSCHAPQGENVQAVKFDLTGKKAYETLLGYGRPSLFEEVKAGYEKGHSPVGGCHGKQSQLLARIAAEDHREVQLDKESRERLILWLDTYAQKSGSFSPDQEKRLEALKRQCRDMLQERKTVVAKRDEIR